MPVSIGWTVRNTDTLLKIYPVEFRVLSDELLRFSRVSGLLLWNVFENRKRTFSVFKTDRQPYGLENDPFSGEIFRFSFSGRPPLGNGAPFSINIVIETGAWIWSHGFPHIVRGNKRSNVPKTAGQAAPAWQLLSPNTHPHTPQAPRRADGIGQ